MYNLIRKDIVLQKNSLLILLPILVLSLIFELSFIYIGIIFSISLIMNAFSIDEKPSINHLFNSLPYTRREIVSSKYITAVIFVLMVVLTITIGNLIIHQELTPLKESGFIISLVMVFTAVVFPFSYKFKIQYFLSTFLVLFVVYLVVVSAFQLNWNDQIREGARTLLSLQDTQMYLFISISVIVLYACSWLLSIHIYRKKVF